MNKYPEVSVIITTFNRKKLLSETIYSIINQTFTDLEIIIVDNYSDYDFYQHVGTFNDKRIRPLQNKNNGIIAINRNYGIKKSKGQFISFCDDDDLWHPDKIQKQIIRLKSSTSKINFSMQKEFGNTSIFSKRFGINPFPFKVKTSTKDLIKNNCIPLSSVLMDRTIIDKVGFFNEEDLFLAVEDNELWIRISKRFDFDFLPEVLVRHRNHKNNFYDLSKNILDKRKAIISKHSNHEIDINQNLSDQTTMKIIFRNLFNFFYEKLFF